MFVYIVFKINIGRLWKFGFKCVNFLLFCLVDELDLSKGYLLILVICVN